MLIQIFIKHLLKYAIPKLNVLQTIKVFLKELLLKIVKYSDTLCIFFYYGITL